MIFCVVFTANPKISVFTVKQSKILAIPGLFFVIFVFTIQFFQSVVNDWIRTEYLWCWKQQLPSEPKFICYIPRSFIPPFTMRCRLVERQPHFSLFLVFSNINVISLQINVKMIHLFSSTGIRTQVSGMSLLPKQQHLCSRHANKIGS